MMAEYEFDQNNAPGDLGPTIDEQQDTWMTNNGYDVSKGYDTIEAGIQTMQQTPEIASLLAYGGGTNEQAAGPLPKIETYSAKDADISAGGVKSIADMLGWTGAKDDMKTSIVASMIAGMFGAKNKQQLADASTKNADAATLNAKTNADLAANTIGLRNNASRGMTGAGILSTPQAPKFVDIPAQRIRPGA